MSDTEDSTDSELETAAALLLIAQTYELNHNTFCIKKKRRKTREWIRRREANKGLLFMINNELLKEDQHSYRNFLRMNNENLEKLLTSIENDISKTNTFMRDAIPARNRYVCFFLSYNESA